MRRAVPIAIVVALLASCGGSFTDTATKTVTTSLEATNAARDQMVRWDEAHQLAIVDTSSTRDEATARLSAYRAKRQHAIRAFGAAYAAIAASAAIIPLVEAGKKPKSELVKLLAEGASAVQTALAVYGDLQESGVVPLKDGGANPPDDPPNPEPSADGEGGDAGPAADTTEP